MSRAAAILGLLLLGLLIAIAGAWGTLALAFAGPANDAARAMLAAAFALASLAAVIALGWRRWRWRGFGVYFLVLAAWTAWYASLTPTNTRDWQADVAVLPYADINGDLVTVHNIRNFDYRTETDYTPAYYDKTFDLRRLQGVDLIAVYWMGPAIAHVFLSFAFDNHQHLAISIESRKAKGQAYSTLKGFFRQYELYYVVADERDVIRLRTNFRHNPDEQVYVYRAFAPIENGRRLFLEYMSKINGLRVKPVFYNTLTTNCTTNIWLNSRVNPEHLPFSWKILVSGYVPEFLYEHGRLRTGGLSFSELQQRAHINARAHAAGEAADFSRRIRDETEVATGPGSQ
jgi:hypothetical protein